MELYLLIYFLAAIIGYFFSYAPYFRYLPTVLSIFWIFFRFIIPYEIQTTLIHYIHIAILDFVFTALLVGNIIGNFIQSRKRLA